jgi:hypothetical protein
MRSTSPPRHGRHAQGAPGPATWAPRGNKGTAGPRRRRRRAALLLILAPVTAGLVVVALIGVQVMNRPIHAAADTSRYAGTSAGSTLSATPHCCIALANGSALPRPSASPTHHAAKRSVSAQHHTVTHATASSSASTSGAVSTGGDGSSPPGSVAGWKLTYSTDFPGSSLPSGWGAYSGEPGGDPDGNWDPSNVSVSGNALHLAATSSSQGGVQFYGNPQTYGMYLVRMKGDNEPGLAINNLALLWPAQQGVWPPEVDFYEDTGASRQSFNASLHAGPDGNYSCCVVHSPDEDSNGTTWHTYGVQWTPDTMTYTIDGRVWGSVSRSSVGSPAQWPSIPMNLSLQSQNQISAQPSGTIETMTVAWVAEYAMNG